MTHSILHLPPVFKTSKDSKYDVCDGRAFVGPKRKQDSFVPSNSFMMVCPFVFMFVLYKLVHALDAPKNGLSPKHFQQVLVPNVRMDSF